MSTSWQIGMLIALALLVPRVRLRLASIAAEAKVDPAAIYELVFVCNPVMHHLLVALTLVRAAVCSKLFSEAEIRSYLNAALTMNISMLTLQARLRTQVEPLSREQKESIRKHPERSADKPAAARGACQHACTPRQAIQELSPLIWRPLLPGLAARAPGAACWLQVMARHLSMVADRRSMRFNRFYDEARPCTHLGAAHAAACMQH